MVTRSRISSEGWGVALVPFEYCSIECLPGAGGLIRMDGGR